MNTNLIEYTPEQINQACQTGSFVCITFHDGWCGVEDVILAKVTEKCIWPKQSSQARVDKTQIGSIHWSNAFVIKGDENQAIDTYYSRVIEEKEKEIAQAQGKIVLAQNVIQDRIIAERDPETKKWIRK